MVGHMHRGFRIMFLSVWRLGIMSWRWKGVDEDTTWMNMDTPSCGFHKFSQTFMNFIEFCYRKNIENNGIPCSVLSTSSLNCSSSSKWDFAGFADRAPCEVDKLPITTNNNRLPLFEILWFLFLPKGGTTIQHPQHAWTPWQFFTYFIDSCRYSCKVLFVWWPVDHDVHTLTTWICPWPSWTRPLVVNYQIEESKVAIRKTFTCYILHI